MDLGFGMKITKIARGHIVFRRLMIASAAGGCFGRIMDVMNRSQEPSNSHPQVSLALARDFRQGYLQLLHTGSCFGQHLAAAAVGLA